MKCIRTEVIGCGHYLPQKVLTNDDLSKMVETNDEWISTRTGIRSRHVAQKDELTSDMALKAVNMALKNANVSAEELDLVLVATATPDLTTPATACILAKKLGVKSGTPAFDMNAVNLVARSSQVFGVYRIEIHQADQSGTNLEHVLVN